MVVVLANITTYTWRLQHTRIFGIMFEVGLLIASLKISTLVTNLFKHMQNDLCNFVEGILLDYVFWLMWLVSCNNSAR